MKVSGAIIQDRNIRKYSEEEFRATYKGHSIEITTDHGFGSAKYAHLRRYMIDVTDSAGRYAVESVQDFHEIKDAIRYALEGAQLI